MHRLPLWAGPVSNRSRTHALTRLRPPGRAGNAGNVCLSLPRSLLRSGTEMRDCVSMSEQEELGGSGLDVNREDTPPGERPPRCVACVACEVAREHISPGRPTLDDVPELPGPETLASYPGLTSTNEEHTADLEGLLARYDFDEHVPCSLKGGHPHSLGVVVKTLCGLTLCMGTRCGARCIVGFQDILNDLKRRTGHHNNLRLVAAWPAQFGHRLDVLRKRLRIATDVAQTMKRHLPTLDRAMKVRATQGAKGAEVIIAHARSHDESRHEIRGLALFRRLPSLDTVEESWSRFNARRSSESGFPSAELADELARLASAAERSAGRTETWLDDASSFLTPMNVALALRSMGVANPAVEQEDGGLRVRYMPESALLRPFR